MPPGNDALYAEIQRRMIETGEWDKLTAVLTKKLNESGWIDDIHHRSKEAIRRADPKQTVQELLNELRPDIQSTVSPAVRQEMSALIRQYLESQIEK